MRINSTLIASIILTSGLIAFAFTWFQINSERTKLNGELGSKSIQTAESFYNSYLTGLTTKDSIAFSNITDSIIQRYNLSSFEIYLNTDTPVILTNIHRHFTEESKDIVPIAIAGDSSLGRMISVNDTAYYQFVRVIQRDSLPTAAAVFFTNAQYIDHVINDIQYRSFWRWFLQALVISGVTMLIIRRGVLAPLNKVISWVKDARSGDIEKIQKRPPSAFLEPLYKEITSIAFAMQEAKAIAQEEAKLRTASAAVWTAERLNEEMKALLRGRKLVVVSNREPYMHIRSGKEIQCIRPASGMVTALEPILKACGGLWIASGSGDADKETVDENDKVSVPPGENKYTLRRIWLSKEDEDHFYYGFSNEGLWPLCHIAHTRPVFRKEDWDAYCRVNEMYAEAVLEEVKNEKDPFILVQDYHFALLPQYIKRKRADVRIALFWHIPWPNPESFGICPWQNELLTGMLGADIIGFHTQYHCNHFLQTVNKTLESRVIWENFSVMIGEQRTVVKPFPISIAFTLKDFEKNIAEKPSANELLKQHGIQAEYMGIGVDRIDYTKGLLEKFLAIERFFEKYPEYIGRFCFVQIGATSRALLKTYADTINAVEKEVNRINWKLKTKNWQPILFLRRHHSHEEIEPYYRSADLCFVSSLHDGMNLVAKEFIASRTDQTGVLILSVFAGAAQELSSSFVVNPYDIEQCADALYAALNLPEAEQRQKMKRLRRSIMNNNVYHWAAEILKNMASV